MKLFYTPDIEVCNELPEEEAAHCLRVLRLQTGDDLYLTDGKGNFYKAVITAANHSAARSRLLRKWNKNRFGQDICIWLWHPQRIWTARNGSPRKLLK